MLTRAPNGHVIRKVEEVAHRLDRRVYEGPGPEVAEAREAATHMTELVDLHARDNLADQAAMADLEQSLTAATAVVQQLEAQSVPEEPARS
ncbi:hypothetical protein Q5762_31340 [Streptomyces sp. P9(2023)]|uniref:hypothetical protein n=1 Tax=Streptomyces sp. P9(2023) TaxID=3064394 RepID=UPI0028F41528|nr:hypothetical protein [Streptomyces sp. P9(2023)]MDT9692743.1 hypothetical protein [Streptomyces sp. P9(2023)]